MCATQLDICNIYTSKFCTKPKLIRHTNTYTKKKKWIREWMPQEKGTNEVDTYGTPTTTATTEKKNKKKRIRRRSEQHTHRANLMWLFMHCELLLIERVWKRERERGGNQKEMCPLNIYLFFQFNFCHTDTYSKHVDSVCTTRCVIHKVF